MGLHDKRATVQYLIRNVTDICSTVIGGQYSTVQYSAVQYSAVQYSTAQHSTVQYSTVPIFGQIMSD